MIEAMIGIRPPLLGKVLELIASWVDGFAHVKVDTREADELRFAVGHDLLRALDANRHDARMAHISNKNSAGMGMVHLVRLVHPRALRIDEHALATLETGSGTLDRRAVSRVGD